MDQEEERNGRLGSELQESHDPAWWLRCRLSQLADSTLDLPSPQQRWPDHLVASRSVARNVAQAIAEAAGVLLPDWPASETPIRVWLEGGSVRISPRAGPSGRTFPVPLLLTKNIESDDSAFWNASVADIEAIIGLSTWWLFDTQLHAIDGVDPGKPPSSHRILFVGNEDDSNLGACCGERLRVWKEGKGILDTSKVHLVGHIARHGRTPLGMVHTVTPVALLYGSRSRISVSRSPTRFFGWGLVPESVGYHRDMLVTTVPANGQPARLVGQDIFIAVIRWLFEIAGSPVTQH